MAFQVVPQAVSCTIEGRMDNQLTILDLSFVNSGAVSLAGMADLGTSLADWLFTSLGPLLSRDWTSTRIRIVDESDAIGPVSVTTAVTVGGVDVESAPNNVAACVSFKTAQRGRNGHGRNFVMGIPNSVITLNTLDSTFIDDLVAAYFTLIGAGTFATGWQWCLISRRTGGAERPTGITIPIVAVEMVTNTVKSMRSREVGHGA